MTSGTGSKGERSRSRGTRFEQEASLSEKDATRTDHLSLLKEEVTRDEAPESLSPFVSASRPCLSTHTVLACSNFWGLRVKK